MTQKGSTMRKFIAGTAAAVALVGAGVAAHAATQPPQPYDFGVTYVIWPDARPDTLFVRVTHNGRSVRYRCDNAAIGSQSPPDGSFRESFKSDPSVHCPIG